MRKNILILLADQLRSDCLGCSLKYDIKTPNIDSLAKKGMMFRNAYTPIPVCAPARQALLSGLHPDSFGAMWNYDFFMTPTLSPGATWTEALRETGYTCGFFGHWHNSATNGPEDFGYDYVMERSEYSEMIRKKYPGLKLDPSWLGCSNPVRLEDSETHFLAEGTADFIRSNSDKPWHIRVDFSDPHLPCRPSAPYDSMYKAEDMVPWDGFGDKFINKPYIHAQQPVSWGIDGKPWEYFAPMKARYFGMISQLDDAVGRILSALDKSGQTENTVVIFTSDHGDMCGSHGMLDKHYTLYDDVTRVPLIIAGAWEEKGSTDAFVSNCLDISPTIRELNDLPQVKTHGRTLSEAVHGNNKRKYITSSGNGQQFGLFTQRMITDGEYKYVWNLTDTDELYRLTEDPGEKNNLIHDPDHTEKLSELRKELRRELIEHEDKFAATGWLDRQLLEGKKL